MVTATYTCCWRAMDRPSITSGSGGYTRGAGQYREQTQRPRRLPSVDSASPNGMCSNEDFGLPVGPVAGVPPLHLRHKQQRIDSIPVSDCDVHQ